MALPYFRKFPTIQYNKKTIVDIFHRFRIRQKLVDNSYVYYTYQVKDGESPETIAHLYYGDARLHWLILFANNIIDPYFDWCLSYDNFNTLMVKLYGSIQAAKNLHHHYQDADGDVVDKDTFDNLEFEGKREVFVYDYWFDKNEEKRTIKIIDKAYAPQIDRELSKDLSS